MSKGQETSQFDIELGRRLAELRVDHEFSSWDVADYLEVSSEQVDAWETGQQSLPVNAACTLAEIYEITLDQLVHGDTEEDEESQESPSDSEFCQSVWDAEICGLSEQRQQIVRALLNSFALIDQSKA